MGTQHVAPSRLLDGLVANGASLITGVPCSFLAPLIDETLVRRKDMYVPASSEGDAVAIAAGAWLGGGLGVVMCQNSGLGNMINPLTSLTAPFEIPVLLLVTWRGCPGEKDEPQHELMGAITLDMLRLLGLGVSFLPDRQSDLAPFLEGLFQKMSATRKAHAIVIRHDDLAPCSHTRRQEAAAIGNRSAPSYQAQGLPEATRAEALSAFLSVAPDDCVVIATTGKCGRELFTLRDQPQHLYCVGSMGYASSLANGLALTTSKQVYVLDGDGAAIMHLGNLATIGAASPANLTHVVLDNGTYDSTGGQPTVSALIDFPAVASACGYTEAFGTHNLLDFKSTIRLPVGGGPRLIHHRIRPGSLKDLGRPTLRPSSIALRMRQFVIGAQLQLAS